MSSSRKRIADSAVLGKPRKKMAYYITIETVRFTIHNFRDRKEKRRECIRSRIFKSHGYNWTIDVYPRGHESSSTQQEFIAVFLCFCDQNLSITADIDICCKSIHYGFRATIGSKGSGDPNFISRNEDLAHCLEDDGSLVIEVDIRIGIEAENNPVWYPKELFQQDILVELYHDASSEFSDVAFSVDGTTYRAHKSILSLRCKKLYEIAMECECDNDSPIPIDSVKGNVFKSILDFVYTVKTPNIENEDIATELLVASDRFDCIHLKLYVESIIVDKFLDTKNAAEWLIFADSHSCAQLKEAATDFFIADMETVKSAEAWSKVKESHRLVLELLDSIQNKDGSDEIDCMDVSALRNELQEANLELDGSREVLVDRLKKHRESQAEGQ